MAKKATYSELQRRVAELEAQQPQQLVNEISAHKLVDQSLRNSEEWLRAMADAMLQLAWVANPDGWIHWYNRRWYEYTGTTPEQMAGWGWQSVHDPELLPKILEQWKASLGTGEPFEMVFPLRGADGRFRRFLTRGHPMKDSLGRVVQWFGTNTDVDELKRTEEALRESEERLSFALQTIQTGAWDLDLADHTTFRSLEHDHIFGYAELLPEWTYEMFLDHVLPEDRPAVDSQFRQAIETHSEWKFECRIRRTTGEIRWIMAAGRHRSDATGAQRHMAGIVQDITTRKQAEEALKESEERFHTMFERHHAVKLMIEPETGDIVDANAAAYRFYGYSREQLCSLRIQDINQLPPDEVAAERAKAAAAQRNYFVFPHRLANSEVRWVEVYSTLVETRGRPLLYSIIHDITDRTRAEEALRESEERYRKLFDNMTEAFAVHEIVTDKHGRPSDYRFLEVNAAFEQMTGLKQSDILNRNVRDVLPEIEPFWIETYGRVALTREPVNFEHYYPAPLNRWYQVCAYCPAPGQFATVFWDVSRRKRAEEALQEANATLERKVQARTSELAQQASQLRALAGELTLSEQRERSRLAKILHDHLQQLLVAAKFRLTVLGRGGDDVVKQATNEVEELINESIAASRSLTAELSPPILHEAGLNAGLEWLAREMADKYGLFVNLEMEEHGPLAEPLKILLFESVRELLFNVVKHARTGSANVNLRRVDSHLQVTVSDQGAGFDMSIAGEDRKGFGLFAIRERMGFMGGTLQTQSTPGQGSRFVLSVPFAPIEKIEPQSQEIFALSEAHRIPSLYPKPGRKIRVMLVDDHAVVRQGMANLLEDEPDIEVIGEAADGQEAVELAARLLPDVILMDLSMPKLNGVEATRIIHNDWPEIRIIGLSMFEEADRAQAMRDAGAVDYTTKSGPADALINLIRTSNRASNKVLSPTSKN